LKQTVSKSCQVFRRCEQTGMSSHTAQNARIFILYFALDNSMTEADVVSSGRNGIVPTCGRIKGGVRHPQWTEELALAEAVESLIGNSFQCDAENNKANVAVFGSGAWICREWCGESGSEQVGFGLHSQKQLFVCGQAGGVRQQHA